MSNKVLIDASFKKNIRVASIKGANLDDFDFELSGNESVRGNIYLAKVVRVENSLQAAFIDYGQGKNGFLSIVDIHPDYFQIPTEDKKALLSDIEESRNQENDDDAPENTVRKPSLYKKYNISEVIRKDQLLLVQAVKEERGNKGAALTTYISISGRYLVFMPNTPGKHGVSRKIHGGTERQRIREILDSISCAPFSSVVVRTAGKTKVAEDFQNDYQYLFAIWNNIKEKTLSSKAPAFIFSEESIIKNAIREYGTDASEVIVEGDDAYNEAMEFAKMLKYDDLKIVNYISSIPLFVKFGIEEQITKLLDPRVVMSSGASLVFQQTEALVSVDVNSGRSTSESNIEETAFKTNMDAVSEIARQLRLRNLSGLVVVDFIDMLESRNRSRIENELRRALDSDRVRTQILPINDFGLLVISRQRTKPSVMELFGSICETCHGGGFVKMVDHAAVVVLRGIASALYAEPIKTKYVSVSAASETILHILNYKRTIIETLEKQYGMMIIFKSVAKMRSDDFEMVEINKPNHIMNFENFIESESTLAGSLISVYPIKRDVRQNSGDQQLQRTNTQQNGEGREETRNNGNRKRKRNNGNRNNNVQEKKKKPGIIARFFKVN